MRETLAAACRNFIENRNRIKSAFAWESAYIHPVCAAIFTDQGQQADVERMKYCQSILKEETGIFSNFRGNAKLALVSMMAVDCNPEEKLRKSLQIYNLLKEYFFSGQYLPVASMVIADVAPESRYGEIAARTRNIYNLMKREHPFLTSGEDSVFAALLALSDLTDEQVVQETEDCYRLLKPEFFSGNAVQSLSHVLALGEGQAEEKCRRVMELYRGLKERGCRYGTDYELASLGVLALLPAELSCVMADMVEADDFLAQQKGYGILGVGRKQRLMHAGMLVSGVYINESGGRSGNLTMNSAAIGGTISLIAAQQAAMYAAIAASSAAAANSSSN